MGMSLDMQEAKKSELIQSMATAMKSNDEVQMAQAFADFSAYVQAKVQKDYAELSASASADATVLASRGYRQLTNAETKYYNALSEAMKSTDVRMALQNLEAAMPETVIDSVMQDVVQAHPLLDAIHFENTHGSVKMLANAGGIATAVWGKLTDSKKRELEGSITEVDATLLKLLAYIPVPRAMVELGPVWLDAFVRAILGESIALGLEDGIINGDGNETPIGMIRAVGASATITGGKYAEKTAKKVKSFDKKTYGELLSTVTKNSETGAYRDVPEVTIVVNPSDYFTRVMPATTFLNTAGVYLRDVFPYPTKVVRSCAVPAGKAVFGLANRYYMCLGMGKQGRIEYDDSVQFLEDARVYMAKMYGNGMPLDNNAFLLLDISELEEARIPVTTWIEQPEADAAGAATKTK